METERRQRREGGSHPAGQLWQCEVHLCSSVEDRAVASARVAAGRFATVPRLAAAANATTTAAAAWIHVIHMGGRQVGGHAHARELRPAGAATAHANRASGPRLHVGRMQWRWRCTRPRRHHETRLPVLQNHFRGQGWVIGMRTIRHIAHGEDVARWVHHDWRARWALGRSSGGLLCQARRIVCCIECILERRRSWRGSGEGGCSRGRWPWTAWRVPQLRQVRVGREGRTSVEVCTETRVDVTNVV